MQDVKVLFVCLGNICRSPMAEGIFRKLAEDRGLDGRITVDSAGTGSWHVGEPPDRRAQGEVKRYGIDISRLRGRQVTARDCERFDYVVAMDDDNFAALEAMCPPAFRERLHKCTDFAPGLGADEVPDPFYGGPEGFERVYTLIEANANALLDRIVAERLTPDTPRS